MGRHLEVTDRRMAAAVTLVLAEPLIAGTPSLRRAMMGKRMLNRGAFAPRGASALGCDLGAALGLARFVLTDMQQGNRIKFALGFLIGSCGPNPHASV